MQVTKEAGRIMYYLFGAWCQDVERRRVISPHHNLPLPSKIVHHQSKFYFCTNV